MLILTTCMWMDSNKLSMVLGAIKYNSRNQGFKLLNIQTHITKPQAHQSVFATLGSILDSQLRWESGKFHQACIIFWHGPPTHPPTHPLTPAAKLFHSMLCDAPTQIVPPINNDCTGNEVFTLHKCTKHVTCVWTISQQSLNRMLTILTICKLYLFLCNIKF